MEIQVAYHYFGGDIKREFISSDSYKPSNSFTRKAILMQYPQAEDLTRTRKEVEKRYSELRSGMSGPNTLGQYYSAIDKLEALLSSIDHDKRNFKNIEPSIALKEKYTEGDYFLAYAAQQFTDGDNITLRNLLIGIGYPQEGLARNMVYDFNAKVWDSKVYNAADALSIVLAPVGLDIIGDGIGLVYSGLRGNIVDASMYGASVLIAVVPGGALRIMRRGAASAEDVLVHGGRFYRQSGDQLIEMSFEKADLITTFKFKNPDALGDDLVSSFFEALKENKVSDDLMTLIRNTADDNEKLRLLANNVGGIENDFTILLLKSGEDFTTLTKARNLPGTARGSGKDITGDWLKGTEGNAGLFPKSVADKLRGKSFKNFDEFRRNFWKEVANEPYLANQFSRQNIAKMKEGLAPSVKTSQQLGGQQSYILHHKTPINQGGEVYDVDNLYIVSPLYHKEILAPEYHYGYGY